MAVKKMKWAQFCSKCGAKDKLQWHHIQPRRFHGKDDVDNMAPLCRSCHAKVHKAYSYIGLSMVRVYMPDFFQVVFSQFIGVR